MHWWIRCIPPISSRSGTPEIARSFPNTCWAERFRRMSWLPVAALGGREWIAHLYQFLLLCGFLVAGVSVAQRLRLRLPAGNHGWTFDRI